MNRYLFTLLATIVTIFTQCDTLKGLPTNTSGNLFSLNGSWRLESTSDNGAMVGTVVQVFPGISDATVRTLSNNNYCLRERDVIWRNLKSYQGGTFSLDNLVNACNGNVYYAGTLTAISNDEIRITGKTTNNTELIQTFRRVQNQ